MLFRLRHRYTGHQGSIYALAVSKLKNHFYSGGSDRIVAEWNTQKDSDGELITRTSDAVYSLLHLPGQQQLWVGQGSGGIHVISLEEKKEERLLQVHDAAVFDMRYYKGRVFSTGGDGVLSVSDPLSGSCHSRLRLSAKKLRCIAFHPEGSMAIAGCGEGEFALVDLETLKPAGRLQAHQPDHSVNTICFSRDGQYLLSGSRDAHLNVFDALSLKLLESIPAHNYALYAIAYSPDGRYFASASRDKTVKIWSAEDFSVIQRLEGNDGKGHVNSVNCLLWTDNMNLLSAGDDRAIAAWEMSGEEA
jgi:WD40 repeat protein